jgi:hypothetical protein
MITASICEDVSKYLCGSVPLCASEVGLIGRSLLLPLLEIGPGDITRMAVAAVALSSNEFV